MKDDVRVELEVGTYCGPLQKRILVSTCPLVKRSCMWQHRLSQKCCYTQDELSPDEFCSRVGLPPPTSGEVELRKTQIVQAVKDSFKDCK